jgi:lactate permease
VDIVASMCSLGALGVLLKFWRPKDKFALQTDAGENASSSPPTTASSPAAPAVMTRPSLAQVRQAWLPWILLAVLVFIWGTPPVRNFFNVTLAAGAERLGLPSKITAPEFAVAGLHGLVLRAPPVAPRNAPPEKAIYTFNWLSATGTGILVAALLAGTIMGFSPRQLLRHYGRTLVRVRFSLLTIAAMLALGYVTKYSGADATLGLALARTGSLYPFFGTLLGWLGVALTGSDTASNVLFGGLQRITAEQTHINPVLMCAANSTGGVMGKMVDAQSIVVASTATNWYGHEGSILRYVFFSQHRPGVTDGSVGLSPGLCAAFYPDGGAPEAMKLGDPGWQAPSLAERLAGECAALLS